MELLNQYKDIQKKLKAYGYVLNIVGWDSQTEAPRGAFPKRAEMVGIINQEESFIDYKNGI